MRTSRRGSSLIIQDKTRCVFHPNIRLLRLSGHTLKDPFVSIGLYLAPALGLYLHCSYILILYRSPPVYIPLLPGFYAPFPFLLLFALHIGVSMYRSVHNTS